MSSGYRITELSLSHSESIWEIEEPDFPAMADEPDVTALLERCQSVATRRMNPSRMKQSNALVKCLQNILGISRKWLSDAGS